jgi:hypothetical protein
MSQLRCSGAKFNLNQGLIDYTRYFAFLHRMAWVEASVPIANLSGSISGIDITGSTTGTGDSGYTGAIIGIIPFGKLETADHPESLRLIVEGAYRRCSPR